MEVEKSQMKDGGGNKMNMTTHSFYSLVVG